jgi:hypothetical protein
MRFLRWTLVVLLAVGTLAFTTTAQGVEITDYLGFAWETGGFPPSQSGDVFSFVGVSDWADPLMGVDLNTEEVTFYVHDLVSMGQLADNPQPGWTTTYYSGGVLEMYRDAAMNADYGINPPNGTVPSTFTDGTLLLSANFTSFAISIDPFGNGSYGGAADGTGGELITSCTGCIYTWGGSFTVDAGAQLPEGYDIQMDGILDIDSAVPAPTQAWGALKAKYGSQR